MALPFAIKICGITKLSDAMMAADAGADAIGLNFYSKSPRSVTVESATQIARVLPRSICKVGVFVNYAAEEIESIASEVGLDAIQIHGDEPPELLASLPTAMQVIRAWRLGAEGLMPLYAYLNDAERYGRRADAVLIDARIEGSYGGTGATADWELLEHHTTHLGGIPLVLAGGLTAENIADAIARVRPAAVDAASGVEASPGQKDAKKVAQFVATARKFLSANG